MRLHMLRLLAPPLRPTASLLRGTVHLRRASTSLFNLNTSAFSTMTKAISFDEKGRFKRQQSIFRDTIEDSPSAKYPAEKGRYHLYVSHACPWAHRVMMLRAMKGLEDVISVSVTHYLLDMDDEGKVRDGWLFQEPYVDDLFGSKYIREIYHRAAPEYKLRYTVPLLFDKVTNTIVNNESSEILRILNSSFNRFSSRPDLNLCPPEFCQEIEEVNSRVYDNVNNGVYKCGFAGSDEAYEEAFHNLFSTLDWLEERLSKQRYLAGDTLTEADIRLFTTLLRFDPVYYVHFKTNGKMIRDYPNLWEYTKEIYQLPGVKATVDIDYIKKHYYISHPHINKTRRVPVGPIGYEDQLNVPHIRDSQVSVSK
mmetsp:Transcript_6024/g.14636  ORF Transcript_6024/g.14636 Transcript_6024/m.14636 type:complete len:366 (-) Transcript_6024:390-1487(-)